MLFVTRTARLVAVSELRCAGDQAIGLVAVFVIGLPVGGQLLEGHQQVLPVQRAGAGDRPQHRVEERVDQRVVVGRVLEEQQGQRAGIAQAQAGGVLVDLVVQLAGDAQDALAGLGIDHRAAAQGPRHRGLGDPGQVGDVQGGGFAFDGHGGRKGDDRGMMPWVGGRAAGRRLAPAATLGGITIGAAL